MKLRYWLAIAGVTLAVFGVSLAVRAVLAAGYCPGGTCSKIGAQE